MNKIIQSIFRRTGTERDTTSNNASKKNNKIFQSSNEYFLENGRRLLQERVSLFHGKTNHIRCLSVNDLNVLLKDRILVNESLTGFRYQCVWEGRPVLVKFGKINEGYTFHYTRLEQCCRETAIAAQMGIHKNVHKLLACCLHTESPVLIYEYVENGPLVNRIYEEKNQNKPLLEWEDRLRIAWEISHSVAYLHTAFPRPIVFRDLKPQNVLLDENNAAKLTGFSFCVSIPKGKTSLEVYDIEGTYGYVAPEYMMYWKVAEKTDVYSFGVLFLELLTGQKRFGWHSSMFYPDLVEKYSDNVEESSDNVSEDLNGELYTSIQSYNTLVRNLIADNISKLISPYLAATHTLNEDLLHKQFQGSTELALRCIAEEEDSRPTMEEVATELKNIITFSGSSIPTTSTTTPQ